MNSEPSNAQATSLSLLEDMRLRDAEAWRRLTRVYGPLVRHWCRRAGVPSDAVDDVLQETLAAVVRGLPTFERTLNGGTFRGWLRTIVGRKLIDRHRALADAAAGEGGTSAHLQLANVADPLPAADAEQSSLETGLVFKAAVELIRTEFEPATADAFWQTTIDERPPDEVAQALGLTINAVYKAKSRVLRRLREVLAGLELS
jgi:RNA polymerase sigma-70 factor (ECF subfamily)